MSVPTGIVVEDVSTESRRGGVRSIAMKGDYRTTEQ